MKRSIYDWQKALQADWPAFVIRDFRGIERERAHIAKRMHLCR